MADSTNLASQQTGSDISMHAKPALASRKSCDKELQIAIRRFLIRLQLHTWKSILSLTILKVLR